MSEIEEFSVSHHLDIPALQIDAESRQYWSSDDRMVREKPFRFLITCFQQLPVLKLSRYILDV